MTPTGYLHRFCTQIDTHAHTRSHALLPLSQRLTLVPEAYTHSRAYTHSDRCSLSRAKGFPFGSLCAELTFIPPEVHTVMFGCGQKSNHGCPGVF